MQESTVQTSTSRILSEEETRGQTRWILGKDRPCRLTLGPLLRRFSVPQSTPTGPTQQLNSPGQTSIFTADEVTLGGTSRKSFFDKR